MIIVTGTAPRCGTSAMMRLLLEHYDAHSYIEPFPSYAAREKNPEGFWDLKGEHLFGTDPIPSEDAAIKLWAPQFPRVDVEDVKLVIVMQRGDFLEQCKSIRSCAVAEGLPDPDPALVARMFHNQQTGIESTFSETPMIRVQMESLRADPDSVISYIKEIV